MIRPCVFAAAGNDAMHPGTSNASDRETIPILQASSLTSRFGNVVAHIMCCLQTTHVY
jgi:hypothetical protein